MKEVDLSPICGVCGQPVTEFNGSSFINAECDHCNSVFTFTPSRNSTCSVCFTPVICIMENSACVCSDPECPSFTIRKIEGFNNYKIFYDGHPFLFYRPETYKMFYIFNEKRLVPVRKQYFAYQHCAFVLQHLLRK